MASTERDNSGLEADIGITLGKLTKQLAAAEARMIKTANKFQSDFANANRAVSQGFERTSKSAQSSANAMGKEMDRLRAKYDPIFAASKRYEAELEELNRAHKVGAINVAQYERALDTLNASYTRSTSAVAQSTTAMSGLLTVTRGTGGGIQNVAFQVGDFATQVGAGTSASIALGQQLPQLLGGFGALGAVMGAVVAVGVPLTRVLLENALAGGDLSEKLEALEEAVQAYNAAVAAATVSTDDLREKYGAATAAAQDFLGVLVQVTEQEALDELSGTVREIARAFGSLDDRLTRMVGNERFTELELAAQRISREFGVTQQEAMRIAEALREVDQASRGTTEQQVTALQSVLALLQDILGPIEQMDGGARTFAEQIAKAGEDAAQMVKSLEDANQSTGSLVTGIVSAASALGTMVEDAASLGDNMLRAANAAYAFLQARARERQAYDTSVGRGRGGDPRDFGGSAQDIRRNDPAAQLAASEQAIATARTRAASRAARRSGGGGGRSAAQTAPGDALFQTGQRAIQNLERQIEMLGKSRAEVVALTAKYRLLDEAKRRNIDLDERQTATGKTVRETIDDQANSIEALYRQYEKASERARVFNDMQADIKDGFLDAIVEGENFGDVLANVAKQLARAALQAAFFNEGIFASGSGGGLLGGLFSGARKLLSFDGGGHTGSGARTGGVDGKGGFFAIMHPDETVIDHKKGGMVGMTINLSMPINAPNADAAALKGLQMEVVRMKQELPTKILKVVRTAPKKNIAL